MKKLEDIPKNNIFEVPDGYFDKLPGIIQSRIAAEKSIVESRPFFVVALQYAIPIVVLAVAGIFILQNYESEPRDTESLLASVSNEELVSYLMYGDDASTEELLEGIDLNDIDINSLQEEPLMDIDLNEQELNNLTTELENEYF
jgi:hypothetical protein